MNNLGDRPIVELQKNEWLSLKALNPKKLSHPKHMKTKYYPAK
jgi:hypothetical protein